MKTLLVMTMVIFAMTAAYGNQKTNEVQVVSSVDLSKFLGKWYEIAVIPYFWERNCVGTNANYSLRPDGRIDVLNICQDKTLDGKTRTGHGVAVVADLANPAKLKVSFFGPFYAPYWIIDLGQNYEYAVTASPNRRYLWILSRTPHMDESLYNQLLARASGQGFDVTKLVKTPQR